MRLTKAGRLVYKRLACSLFGDMGACGHFLSRFGYLVLGEYFSGFF